MSVVFYDTRTVHDENLLSTLVASAIDKLHGYIDNLVEVPSKEVNDQSFYLADN